MEVNVVFLLLLGKIGGGGQTSELIWEDAASFLQYSKERTRLIISYI